MVAVLLRVEDPVFDEDGDGPQHERHEQVHVDEVAGAMQLPTRCREEGVFGTEPTAPSLPSGVCSGPAPPLCRSGVPTSTISLCPPHF